MSYEDDSFSLAGRAHGYQIKRNKEYGYIDGHVVTPYGIVSVYAEGDALTKPYTRLDFVLNGRVHMRIWRKKRLTERGMVTAATRLAREITEAA